MKKRGLAGERGVKFNGIFLIVKDLKTTLFFEKDTTAFDKFAVRRVVLRW